MEYEIDSEEALFDSSTNPSLRTRPLPTRKRPLQRRTDLADPRKMQKGEVIPEEEAV